MSIISIIVILIAGWGAGLVTGLVGASAAVIVTPMLVTFLGYPAYTAIGISLATDVFASSASARTYYKHGNIDIKNGISMAIMAVVGAIIGSLISKYIPDNALGGGSGFVTLIMGIQFIRTPMNVKIKRFKEKFDLAFFDDKKVLASILFGTLIGLICGIVGAGGGIMILFILTFILGYDMKTAVGTSVLIMACTALSGSIGHFIHSGFPIKEIAIASIGGLIGARMASKFANLASEEKLSKIVGIVFIVLGSIMTVQKIIF
ncbi:sulfite exporter TauE/SafE family protein [Oceanirhabdus seepicola]|uniref:Probable membrane transporter protein n=1 Tax=Oceanirhabdus seepicola TaxID=2828781 RepID=A0A9J6NVX6_9CLOT|nr:sulfite exporter TauE/SafE family protein [Oceanirhabdus seepicola]MCM1988204.1 sulfite exporter TauE/SafE family protein [Oceanirhabdus seepicola]